MVDNTNHQNQKYIYDLLSPYLDDEVSEEERNLVEQALANSLELRQTLDSLRQTVDLVAALPALAAPRPFTLSAADAEAISPQPQPKWFRLSAWVGGLAMAAVALFCVLAGGGIFYTSTQFSSEQQASEIAQVAATSVMADEAKEEAAVEEPAEESVVETVTEVEKEVEAEQEEMAAEATEEALDAEVVEKSVEAAAAPEAADRAGGEAATQEETLTDDAETVTVEQPESETPLEQDADQGETDAIAPPATPSPLAAQFSNTPTPAPIPTETSTSTASPRPTPSPLATATMLATNTPLPTVNNNSEESTEVTIAGSDDEPAPSGQDTTTPVEDTPREEPVLVPTQASAQEKVEASPTQAAAIAEADDSAPSSGSESIRQVDIQAQQIEVQPGLIRIEGIIEAEEGTLLAAALQRNQAPFEGWAIPETLQSVVQAEGRFIFNIQATVGDTARDLLAQEAATYQITIRSIDTDPPLIATVFFDTTGAATTSQPPMTPSPTLIIQSTATNIPDSATPTGAPSPTRTMQAPATSPPVPEDVSPSLSRLPLILGGLGVILVVLVVIIVIFGWLKVGQKSDT